MKRNTILVALLTLCLSFSSLAASSGEKNTVTPKERVQQLETRIFQIRESELSSLNKSEREIVKEEVKSIKKEIKQIKGLDDKVSISVGAIIIIILLLIILT